MKYKLRSIRFIFFSVTFLFLSFLLIAQQEEVRVVKPYSPTLSGAEKIQLLPNLDEEIEYEMPQFTYHLFQKRYDSEFRLRPIKAARMVNMPLKKLYKSQLTMGMGNYLTPLAELNINQLRSRNGIFGVNIKHHSMNGKVKLDNEKRVDAGFNENLGEFYGSRFLRNSVFEYQAGASYNSYVHYGVDPGQDSVLARKDALNPYFTAAGGVGLHSMHADSFHINYEATLEYYYFTHKFESSEHAGAFDLNFNKKLRTLDIAGNTGVDYYYNNTGLETDTGVNNTFIRLSPQIAKSSAEWRFTAGFKTYLHIAPGDPVFYFYPDASFQFNIVKEVIVPYFGVDGYLENNGNRSIVEENPYIVPALNVKPTSHKLIAYAGLKGRFSDAVAYNLKGSYSIVDNQYFFVNDTSSQLMNQFQVIYDDLTLLNLQGEFSVRPGDSWKFFLKGNYYNYTMVREEHPWNKPAYDISFQARYNMSDKILVDIGLFTVGARYFENFGLIEEDMLKMTVDGNLGIEYRYTKLLSFWARINNIAAQKYYLYHNYPSYRFRAMLGFSYAL